MAKKAVGKKKSTPAKKKAVKKVSATKEKRPKKNVFDDISNSALEVVATEQVEEQCEYAEIVDDALILKGEITIYKVALLKDWFTRAIHDPGVHKIDTHEVEEIDTAGFQLLLFFQKEKQEMGESVTLINASGCVKELLSLYRYSEQLVAA
ncbi:MAG: STAS domain-containing protein [Gammaproteobacteria bacterium]|nr:STAS domain-containing protein [Gammaproteobacteria bacterium]